jgi:hypothetical protein
MRSLVARETVLAAPLQVVAGWQLDARGIGSSGLVALQLS